MPKGQPGNNPDPDAGFFRSQCSRAAGAAQGLAQSLADEGPEPLRTAAFTDLTGSAQELVRILRREGLAQQMSLRVLALVLLEKHELRETFDALRSYVDLKRAGHVNDRRRDDPVIGTLGDAGDERTVDLEAIHGEITQATEVRVARAEVVDRDGH